MRVLLIAGGWSNEREVSLSGARKIEAALKALGHGVTFLDPQTDFQTLIPTAARHDFAFINLHGSPGEDGLIQAMLEQAACPYQGSGPKASFLALNKAAAKEIFATHGIVTPPWILACIPDDAARVLGLGLPVFVKPNAGGSSLGMSLVRNEAEVLPALQLVFAMGQPALAETYAPGVELTCAVLDRKALPLILIRPRSAFFDYREKYAADGAEEICPAPVEQEVADRVQAMALAAHQALGLSGYSRSDFILKPDGQAVLLEVNTLPGMTPTSLLPKAAAQAGLDFEALVAELIRLGLAAHGPDRA